MANYPVKGCLFRGYTTTYVTNSRGWMNYLLPRSYTDAFILSSRVPTSALVVLRLDEKSIHRLFKTFDVENRFSF